MIAFRLDANAAVATGHMYRCMSIARFLRKAGKECIFLLAEEKYTHLLLEEGFTYHVLNISWEDWNAGIGVVKAWIHEHEPECLVVDSYRVTQDFFAELIEEVPILYMDDLCNCVYRINAAVHYSEWPGENVLADLYKETDVEVYAGMQYMPLREAFARNEERKERRYDLLITTGGSDPYHITLQLLRKLVSHPFWKSRAICAILGKMNSDSEAIGQLAGIHSNITVMQNISNMDEVMRQSYYAVTAGGTSVYELMASRVAFVCFGFSDDQAYFGERLEAHGNALWAGDARDDAARVVSILVEKLEILRGRPEEENRLLIKQNRELLDGQGASRIADIIINLCR